MLIGSLYIVFGKKSRGSGRFPQAYTKKRAGIWLLHEFVDVVELTGEHHTEITLSFPGDILLRR